MFANNMLKIAFKNKYKRWIPMTEKEHRSKTTAMHRFGLLEYFAVNVQPKFLINKKDKIFTVGSCFARNIEMKLVKDGIDVLSTKFSVPQEMLRDSIDFMGNKPDVRSILNKYNTHAIYNEFDRVLNDISIPDNGFVQVKENEWLDVQLSSGLLKPMNFNQLLELRHSVETLIKSSVNADVIFITLGLTETWYDNVTGIYLNSNPPPILMKSDDSRFEFLEMGYDSVCSSIENVILLLRRKSPNIKFILTVSPVPMHTTWTSNDVVVANTYSKSLLRVVSQHMANKYSYVDYFPSYEMVMNSPREMAWNKDYIHVSKEMVSFVIKKFTDSYLC